MFVDVKNIPDAFKVYNRVLNGQDVNLVIPSKIKHKWSDDELHLRSLLVRDSQIICSGFPKFKNFGEDPNHDLIVSNAIANGNVFFAEKLDGSLIIRTVIDGKVNFRTRGSHSLGDFHDAVMALVPNELLDPNVYNDVTMLFEYCSPDNIIVVRYDEPKLVFLGFIEYRDKPVFISNPDLVKSIAVGLNISHPNFYSVGNNITDVLQEVRGWKDSEGIVVWIPTENGCFLSKIKAADYIRLHSLKSYMTYDKIKMLMYSKGYSNVEQFNDFLYSIGFDWEVVSQISSDAGEILAEFKKRRESLNVAFSLTDELISEIKDDEHYKKNVALTLKKFVVQFGDGDLFSVLIQRALGNDYSSALGAYVCNMTGVRFRDWSKKAGEISMVR